MRPFFAVTTALLLAVPNAFASDAIIKCRAIASAAERLACYDAIGTEPVRAPVRPDASASVRPPATAPQPTTAVNAAERPPALPATATFGLTQRTPDSDISAINTEIAGDVDGWGPSTRFRMRNGQVWQIDDGSSGVCGCKDPKVKISRGLFGVFYLEIDGKGHAPKVRRVQ